MSTPPIRPSDTTQDDEDTAVHRETPFDLVLAEMVKLTRKVDALTEVVSKAIDLRLSDEQTLLNSREALRRLDVIEERCEATHPRRLSQIIPPNGSGHG